MRTNMASVCCFADITADLVSSAITPSESELWHRNVQWVRVCELEDATVTASDTGNVVHLSDPDLGVAVHAFRLKDGCGALSPCTASTQPAFPDAPNTDADPLHLSTCWDLPSRSLDGLWDSLIFDDGVPERLLRYMRSIMLFSHAGVDANLVAWNGVVLLHGPPGTGKTSLCKALAHKLAIRLSRRHANAALIEINTHSLFSKYFSESGKLVASLFREVESRAQAPGAFVCLLIDEVESLSAARKSAANASEPSDAIRVVNALLTQIDQLRRHRNVLLLTTSNVTGAIDLAFIDRADIKQYIGRPSAKAIYAILASCITELVRAGVVQPAGALVDARLIETWTAMSSDTTSTSVHLYSIARQCVGFSGRLLRRLPLLAHVEFGAACSLSMDHFLAALSRAVDRELASQRHLVQESGATLSVEGLSLA
ncbi:Pachytene checkpoint protein 2 [Sorochytrium milnesiophthora]